MMWKNFVASLDEELETWQPDYQSFSEEEYANQVSSNQSDGLSPPIFLVTKKSNELIASFLANYKAINISLDIIDDKQYDSSVAFVHNYVVKKEYQKMGIAKKYLKMNMDFLTQVNSFFDKQGRPMTHHVDWDKLKNEPEA